MNHIDKYEYYIINETVVRPEIAEKKLKILSENSVAGMPNLFTITYNQVLQTFNDTNWNGRKYSKEGTMRAITTNPLIQYDLKMGTWTGEYGHPLLEKGMNELARQMTIFPQTACNTIDKIWEDGDILMGQCTTLADGMGEVLRNRILTKYPAMASSRAIGGVDNKGNVLPGYTLITYDSVIRPSHSRAYMVGNSQKVNNFDIPAGNTFNESCTKLDIVNNPSFKDFLLTEATSSQKINMLCDTLNLDFNSMQINENSITMKRISETTIDTVVIPIKRLVNLEYHNLFR